MSSDEEELAKLRAARAEKLGIPVPTRKKRVESESEESSESEEEGSVPDEDQPTVVDVAELYADESRSRLPMEFGRGTDKLQKELNDFIDFSQLDANIANQTDHYFQTKLDYDPYSLPITHEAVLQGHTKVVTCLDIDHSGSRIITGSLDYTISLYDFNGMKSDMQCFRMIEPHEGYPIFSLSFSPSGDRFLAVTGSATPMIYDRDGTLRGEFPRGDMYIRDMKNTRGHVCACCQGQWHPDNKTTAITCSEDGTVRIWDTYEFTQKTVIKPNLRRAARVAVTSCAYNNDGSLIVGGLRDGSIQIWGSKGEKVGRSAAVEQVPAPKLQMIPRQEWSYLANAGLMKREAHASENDITCLKFARTKPILASRCMDGTMKVWDIRKFRDPLVAFEDLPCSYEQTECCFSPDDKLILTGTSIEQSSDHTGCGVIIDVEEMKEIRRLDLNEAVSAVAWHPRLNQIFYGGGTRTTGRTHVMYHPDRSERGALLCVNRIPAKQSQDDFDPPVVVHAPNALPMYQQPRNRKRLLQKQYEEKLKRMRPEGGAAAKELGVGKGGKLGATGGTLLTQYLMKTRGTMRSVAEEADPRDELLRHKTAKEDFGIYTAAYNRTQPKPIYAQVEEEEEKDREADDEED